MKWGARIWAFTAAGLVAVSIGSGLAGAVIGHAVWTTAQTTTVAGGADPSGGGGSSGGSFPGGGNFHIPGFGGGSIRIGGVPGFGGFGGGRGGGGSSSATGAPADVSGIAAKVSPALVDIDSTLGYQGAGGAGTGIVVSADGEVLTNNHVIDGATRITATDIGNGRTYTATVVGYDPSHDVAVLKLQGASGLETATFGDSSKLSVGEGVVGVGNAGGGGGTPSSAGGEITRLDATVTAADSLQGASETLTGMIETNAPIEAGDSGGPLVDAQDEVIGIDTAGSQSFGFGSPGSTDAYAIPIDDAMQIVKQVESGTGSSTVHVGPTAFLGVQIGGTGGGGRSFHIPGFGGTIRIGGVPGIPGFGGGQGSGSASGSAGATPSPLTVSGVVGGQAAQKAGIAEGDTITSLGGTTVDSQGAVRQALFVHHPGDRIEIGWKDGSGGAHTASVTLGSGPAQ